MFFAILTFLSAVTISVIAAGYSIIGLATLFAGATTAIIAMGGALEVGKLVAASWLYHNWNNSLVPRTLKYYLTTAVVVLVFITSMGIFGFLSKAHLDQVQPVGNNTLQITQLDNQINFETSTINRASDTLLQLDKALDKYIDMEYVTRGLKERAKQKEERDALNLVIKTANNKIVELSKEKYELEREVLLIEADIGPLKYVAELIYGDEAKDHFDEAVRWIIIVLIFVFDPLAVMLLIAANITWRGRRLIKESKENKDLEIKTTSAKVRKLMDQLRSSRRQEKAYKEFLKKLGNKNLRSADYEKFFTEYGKDFTKVGIDPDTIRLKMDQIMEWREDGNYKDNI
jgi:hypothetical protein